MSSWCSAADLKCPSCSSVLTEIDNSLVCTTGDRVWAMKNGVPLLVPDSMPELVKRTLLSFCYKWEYNTEALVEERERIATFWFYDRYRPIHGEIGLRDFLRKKNRILDAGCGLGNLTAAFARSAPHAQVWGIDLSPVVCEIPRIHPELDNVRLVQGDILHLPIRGVFDCIISDGVLHHTTNTKETFISLANRLGNGGDIMFYVYRKKAPIREFTDDWIRDHTTKMTHDECLEFCRSMTALGRQLREANVTLEFQKDIPFLGIKAGSTDLQRWFYWHIMKCFWDDGGNEVASVMENFDWYSPPIAHRHDPNEVREWIEDAGLEVVQVVAADSGISAWAHKVKPCL